jgi:GTP-binding protein EngB required for normal cell division
MNAPSYHRERVELARCLDEVTALDQVDREACAWLQNKLNEETFNLVTVGQFKRGKSSVINALLGEALLPVGVTPLTSVVTIIRHGVTPASSVVFETGERRAIGLDKLSEYVTENGNPKNVKGVREVLINYPSLWLESGVRLVDTPGLGSVYEHNSDVTHRYLPQADSVLFVASVDQPMSRAELDFLDSIRPYAAKIFCLLNKIDYLSQDELRESLDFSRQAIEGALGVATPIYPVSARVALAEKRDGDRTTILASGFQEFEQALREFMAKEKAFVWIQSVAHNALRILALARLRIDLQMTALVGPLEQIQSNLGAFSVKKQEVLRAKSEYQILLESSAKSLLKDEIEPSLERLKNDEKERVRAFIDDWCHEFRTLSSRQLQDALEEKISSEIRTSYDGWLAREEPAIAQSFDRICGRFWSDIQGTIDDLLSYSAALFNVQFEAAAQSTLWNYKSGFRYKFWHEPVGLQTLTSSAVLVLPKMLGERLIIARMQKRADHLIEIHAGRIRYDFEERLKRNVGAFCNQLLTRIEATIAGIEGAIDGGLALRDQGEAAAADRRAELKRSVETMMSIERRLTNMLHSRPGEIAA